jgi:hypothetical protein
MVKRAGQVRNQVGVDQLPRRTVSFLLATVIFLTLFAILGWAQGGPPFRSDDPDTPGNNNWEINVFGTADQNPAVGTYETPNVDINYGVGHRIQLKFEIPLSIQEIRGPGGYVAAGLGNSLMGVKWRFYAHHPRSEPKGKPGERESTFGLSVYPQFLASNPTRSVARDIVEPGPQFLLPVEANAKWKAVRMSAEVGYWFTNQHVPRSWIMGAVVGHEFKNKSEFFVELYDQRDVRAAGDEPKLRESIVDIGARIPILGNEHVLFIGSVGRSIVPVTTTNGQPSWIAQVGVQLLHGAKRHSSDYIDPAKENDQ